MFQPLLPVGISEACADICAAKTPPCSKSGIVGLRLAANPTYVSSRQVRINSNIQSSASVDTTNIGGMEKNSENHA